MQHLYAYQRQSPVEMTENELVDARGSWGWPAVPVKFHKNFVMWFKRWWDGARNKVTATPQACISW